MFTDVLEGQQLTLRVNSNVVTWIEKKKPDFAHNGPLKFIFTTKPRNLDQRDFCFACFVGLLKYLTLRHRRVVNTAQRMMVPSN